MNRLQELEKKQVELNKELDKIVNDIYKELYNVEVEDLFKNDDGEYLKVLSIHNNRVKLLIYDDNYVDIAEYMLTQLPINKVTSDNGVLKKLIEFLKNEL